MRKNVMVGSVGDGMHWNGFHGFHWDLLSLPRWLLLMRLLAPIGVC